jgi:hypothetical protein
MKGRGGFDGGMPRSMGRSISRLMECAYNAEHFGQVPSRRLGRSARRLDRRPRQLATLSKIGATVVFNRWNWSSPAG